MPRPTLAQADLFGADDDPGPAPRITGSNVTPLRRRRAAPLPDPEHAASVLDGHDDYRVLRRLKPRPIDPAYRPGPGESIALLVDVETTGLDHRRDEVIEIGMVAFVHNGDGRIGPALWITCTHVVARAKPRPPL